MSKLLRGNFEPKSSPSASQEEASLEEKFEQEALSRLGGSIAYVSRRTFLWNGEQGDKPVKVEGRAAQYDKDRGKK